MSATGRRPTLWVIDPSMHHAEDQGVGEVVRGWSGTSRVFQPALKPGDGPAPEAGYDADGIVVLGSAASVYDNPPWMAPLAAWLRPLVKGEKPVPLLGICFGHQLIAHLARGRVDYLDSERSKLIGVEVTEVSGGRLLPGDHSLRVVVSHCEEVKEAPPGYRITARRGSCPIDGLEHEERPVFTFQFHPEAREEFARHAGIRHSEIDDRLRRDSARVLEAFLRVAEEHVAPDA